MLDGEIHVAMAKGWQGVRTLGWDEGRSAHPGQEALEIDPWDPS